MDGGIRLGSWYKERDVCIISVQLWYVRRHVGEVCAATKEAGGAIYPLKRGYQCSFLQTNIDATSIWIARATQSFPFTIFQYFYAPSFAVPL